jgi:A/G-specific adenine glycosylase
MRVAGTVARTKDFSLGRPQVGNCSVETQSPNPAGLLAWYDRHRRRLPWRPLPGEAADPYRVWLSEIMLQQTTVKTVAPYYREFLQRWPNVARLAEATLEDVLKCWAGLGYYARARNLHACAQAVVQRHGGKFPPDETALRALPGIGAYTAAAVAAIAFDRPHVPVDGNIERVVARLFAIREALPAAKPTIQRLAQAMLPQRRSGDFAQALMDLGATICTPKKPACAQCPWMTACAARARGQQEVFPIKAAKEKGKLRRGAAYVVVRADAAVLVRTRPTNGLLGGMTEVPTSEWLHEFDQKTASTAAPAFSLRQTRKFKWRRIPGTVNHVFTHFPLQLDVYRAEVPARTTPPAGSRWVPIEKLAGEAFPTVMRKVLAHALGADAIKPRATSSLFPGIRADMTP